jgi:hypothetical protein
MKKCSKCKRMLNLKMFSEYYLKSGRNKIEAECYECKRKRNNTRNRALRVQVLTHYSKGKPKCACCGESNIEFLALDHIHGGGRKQRQEIKIRWWEWVRRSGYPEGFRVLCHNCNQSLGVYGYCPHQQGESRFEDGDVIAFREKDPGVGVKLTAKHVQIIRMMIAGGTPQKEIAERYKVSRATICLINKGKIWGGENAN